MKHKIQSSHGSNKLNNLTFILSYLVTLIHMTILIVHHLNSDSLITYINPTCLILVHMWIINSIHGQTTLVKVALTIFGLTHLTSNSFFHINLMIVIPLHLVTTLSLYLLGLIQMHIANHHDITLVLAVEFLTTRLCHQKNGQNFQIFFLIILIYTTLHLIAILMKALKLLGIKLNMQSLILQHIQFLTK